MTTASRRVSVCVPVACVSSDGAVHVTAVELIEVTSHGRSQTWMLVSVAEKPPPEMVSSVLRPT